MLNIYEKFSTEELIEKERILNAEIEALQNSLNRVENEIFYRKNPECREQPKTN